MSDSALWTKVDEYFSNLLHPNDAHLEAALDASEKAGLPAISVSPNQGKLLHLLAQSCNSEHILEIGTLGGYSTIWLARSLAKTGKLVTLEYDPKHAEVARQNIDRAGLKDQVEILVGKAIDSLPTLQSREKFDFVFIDADKISTADYFKWALKLTHPKSLIVVDNVVRKGAVTDPTSTDSSVQGIQRFLELLKEEKRVSATAIQTVGVKGYDGFVLARVRG